MDEKRLLREALLDWTHIEGAAYDLAICLGPMPPGIYQTRAKHIFWSANVIGDMLFEFLEKLTAAGVLEKRDEPDLAYRWNHEFQGSWD